MIRKLSELKDDDMLLVDGCVVPKEDLVRDFKYYKSRIDRVYTTTQYKAHIDARDMLEDALEKEYENNMYEDWFDNILSDVTEDDIRELQKIIDRILTRNKSTNICYIEDEKVIVDIK
ncbi:GTP-binding protein [Clostridium perfringens]|uniref:GTP-binding protein n=1 Tax=Clostridium perfringens TaxID=1502 RepID=UPI002341F286|nr:GTP-binding protein [Clostridium perfringens]MDC4245662.1 GTP-binding protein [Clostridium perfringens]